MPNITPEEWRDWFTAPQGIAFTLHLQSMIHGQLEGLRQIREFNEYLARDGRISGIEMVLDAIEHLKGGE